MISIIDFVPSKHEELLKQCRDLHVQVVETDGMMLRYLPPFPDEKKEKMLAWLGTRRDQVTAGTRHIILAVDDNSKVVGIVMLDKPISETGPFRGTVELLLVSPDHRRQGIARKLMVRLEEVARETGRTLLFLDTTVGTPAADVYPRLGYTKIGQVPNYGFLAARGGALADEVFFYKDLTKASPL